MNQHTGLCKYVITNMTTYKFEWGCNNKLEEDDLYLCKHHEDLTKDRTKSQSELLKEVR